MNNQLQSKRTFGVLAYLNWVFTAGVLAAKILQDSFVSDERNG